jgi:orotate phosphoribosyltransferase
MFTQGFFLLKHKFIDRFTGGIMEAYKQEFVDFMLESNVLRFGDFTLKSGRKSPFFMNAGLYITGSQLTRLGEFYAKAIHNTYGDDFDVIFGPAYKGIPISVATTMAYSKLFGKEVRYCSNRKEAKDHGDAGILLGSPIKDGDRIVVVEDVTTSGKSMEETIPIVKAQGDVEIIGLMVSLNRCERGKGDKGALEEIKDLYGFETNAIVSMNEIIDYLVEKKVIDDELLGRLNAYYEEYGVK